MASWMRTLPGSTIHNRPVSCSLGRATTRLRTSDCSNAIEQRAGGWHAQNRNARRSVRRTSENIRKIEVQRNQTAPLADADFVDRCIWYSVQVLLGNGLDIMAGLLKNRGSARAEVLVQLELHAALISGRSTNRSRLISAP